MSFKKHVPFAIAALLSMSAAISVARASSTAYGDDGSIKKRACSAIGCGGGEKSCADASGKVEVGVPPWTGTVEVTYHCYEANES